jgi:hypothetical protein
VAWPWLSKLTYSFRSSLRTEGLGFDRIAVALNAEALPTRSGKLWHGFTINEILMTGTKTP